MRPEPIVTHRSPVASTLERPDANAIGAASNGLLAAPTMAVNHA